MSSDSNLLILFTDQQAINTLLDIAEKYAGHTKNLGHQTAGTVKQAHGSDGELQTAEADLKVCA